MLTEWEDIQEVGTLGTDRVGELKDKFRDMDVLIVCSADLVTVGHIRDDGSNKTNMVLRVSARQ